MFVVKWIIGIFKALNANTRPLDMGAGIAFALLLALMPSGNLLWVLLFCLPFFLRVHTGTMFIFLAIFKILAPLTDSFLHFIGLHILSWSVLQPVFTAFYELPLVPFTQFNNTLVMGSLITGLVLWLPVCLLFIRLIKFYRDKLREKIQNNPIFKQFRRLPLINNIAGVIRKIGTAANT